MATLTVAEMSDLILDRLQANVTVVSGVPVDPAFTATEILRHINDAYADVFEISGGGLKRVPGGTLWAPQPSTTTDGVFTSLLTDIGEVKDVFHTVTLASTGDVVAGDRWLEPVDLAEIQYMRSIQTLFGKYAVPRLYAVTRNFSVAPDEVNKVQLDVWPGVVGFYLPTHYIPQLVPLDAISVTVPALNDLESRDVALLAASRMGPLTGRAELVPGILADISQRTAAMLERKFSALMDARSDR